MRWKCILSVVVAGAMTSGCDINTVESATDTDGGSGSGSSSSTSSSTSSTTEGGSDSADASSSSAGGSSSDGSSTGGDTGGANARCNEFCDDLVAAGCDNDLTVEGCLLTCQSLTSAESCDPTANAYFDCVEGTTIECDGQGAAYALGCGVAYVAAIGCAVTEDPNPDIIEPCSDYCGTIAEQMCPNSASEDDCNVSCRWYGNTGSGCDDEWQGYLDCATPANWSCLLGYAVPAMCGTEYAAYWECINNPM